MDDIGLDEVFKGTDRRERLCLANDPTFAALDEVARCVCCVNAEDTQQ